MLCPWMLVRWLSIFLTLLYLTAILTGVKIKNLRESQQLERKCELTAASWDRRYFRSSSSAGFEVPCITVLMFGIHGFGMYPTKQAAGSASRDEPDPPLEGKTAPGQAKDGDGALLEAKNKRDEKESMRAAA